MDLTTATPVEIDTALAAIYRRLNPALLEVLTWEDRLDRAQANLRRYPSRSAEQSIEYYQEQLDAASKRLQAIRSETKPFQAEFTRRGGWTRAFLVANANGHVHNSMSCSTCFPTTQFVWLPEYSGHDEAEVVNDAGEKACTVCYPSAPVDVLRRASRIEDPERKAAREAREAAKAERDAKRLAKALLPTGQPLRLEGRFHYGNLETLASAKMWLTDAAGYHWQHPGLPQADIEAVVAAVAAKTGMSTYEVMEAADKRAAKRRY